MGRTLTNMKWNPKGQQVDLILNGNYRGNYFLCEQARVNKNRIPDGYLIEIDQNATSDDILFISSVTDKKFNIKDPDIEDSTEYNYIKNYINPFETALYNSDFIDPQKGYQKYTDLESFVDWYIIQEISKNNDAAFWSSCYVNLTEKGILKMGPLWDFDLGFGNYPWEPNSTIVNNPENFYIKDNACWYTRFFLDPSFVSMLKTKYNTIYEKKDTILSYIKGQASAQLKSVIYNDRRWNILTSGIRSNDKIIETYNNKIKSLLSFVSRRMDWLKNAINEL